MRRAIAATAVLISTLAAVTACGQDDTTPTIGTQTSTEPSTGTSIEPSTGISTSPDADASTSAPADGAKIIDVTISGDSVTPNGDRIEVAVGQPITLDVTADAPGEIHVHSSPEQEFEYAAGTSTITLTPIAQPGIVEIESHSLEKTIVQLEVQ